MSERKWFYMNNQQKEGPIAESHLRQMVSKEILPATVLVWAEGMTGWEPASTVFYASESSSSSVAPVEWFYGLNDEKKGPVSEAELKALLQNQTLNSKSLIWCEKFSDWQTVETVPEFNDVNVPPNARSSKTPPNSQSMNSPSSRPVSTAKTQKPGAPIVPILIASVVLLLLVGAGVVAAVVYGTSMLSGSGKNVLSGPNTQSAQNGDVPGGQAGVGQGVQNNSQDLSGSSVAVTPPVSPDTSSSMPIGFPPPSHIGEELKAMMVKLDSSPELNQTDCSNIPEKDPNFEQNLGIINGTTENHTGNTVWKCILGKNDQLYMVYDPTFSKMYGYELDGGTEFVADLIPANQSGSFPKEVYIYDHPTGKIDKLGILARPDVLYAFQKDGTSSGYFSGTEFISEDGKSEGTITIFPSR